MISYFSLGILILSLGASVFSGRSLRIGLPITNKVRIYKYIFFFSVLIIFALLFYQSWQQYQIWLMGGQSKFLLPPYQPINYFLFYALARFFAPHLISLFFAILFFFSAKALNKKYQERFFHSEEYWMGALAVFLTGHPGWIFYAVLIIFIYLIIQIFSFLISHYSLLRVSLYYLWIPTAIFVIIIGKYWLQYLPVWQVLKF
jgi:hypothetical protein